MTRESLVHSWPMGLAAVLLLVIGCKSKPSAEDQLRNYNAAVKQAIADAAPTYQLLTTMRASLSTQAPPCSGPPSNGLLRISSARLKALTGEPVDERGYLAAVTEASPGKSGYIAGTIEGRVVVFGKDGKPTCHYAYAATNKSSISTWVSYNGGLQAGIVRDIEVEMTREIVKAFGG